MVVGITPSKLVQLYPRLYHMAEPGSWPSIQRHGLLSTSALLDLFQVDAGRRRQIEALHRPECQTILHRDFGSAVIRDQKPMSDKALKKALLDGLTPNDWYQMLNGKVFFWLAESRLERLLAARAYRGRRQTVLTLDTARLLADCGERVRLSPINSGSTVYNPQPRGLRTFLPMAEYPFAEWHRKRGRSGDPIVELTVEHSVPGVLDAVLRVEERGGGLATVELWSR